MVSPILNLTINHQSEEYLSSSKIINKIFMNILKLNDIYLYDELSYNLIHELIDEVIKAFSKSFVILLIN
jgi:hypothetical protein